MNAVLFADSDLMVVDDALLDELKTMARTATLKRSRICLHRSSDDAIQEMVIAFARDSYVRPHRHHQKSESFHVLAGLLEVVLFDHQGEITRRIPLGPPGSGRPSVYRSSSDVWHFVLVETEFVILHEVTRGPFVAGETEFAPWSPLPDDSVGVAHFVQRLRLGDSLTEGTLDSTRVIATSRSPTLTTLICNYNHSRLLPRAIEAMLEQSRPADEFLIVDDGSTDDSVAIIESWVRRYPQIRFLRNERNLGFHASFQRAIESATSDFIYSGAADDMVLPGFFEGAMQLAEAHPTTGVICGQMVSVDESSRPVGTHGFQQFHEPIYLTPQQYLRDVLYSEPATLSLSGATIFRRQPLIDVGGCRVELGSWGDTFSIQALGLQHGVCYWPHPAMNWTIQPGSLSHATRSDPVKAVRIAERAVELMSSPAFRTTFPPAYIQHWEAGFRTAIVHEQLSSVIDGYQAVQNGIQRVGHSTAPSLRWLLSLLSFALRALYFVTFRALRAVVADEIERRAERDRNESTTLRH